MRLGILEKPYNQLHVIDNDPIVVVPSLMHIKVLIPLLYSRCMLKP